jgi:hypothetical protein
MNRFEVGISVPKTRREIVVSASRENGLNVGWRKQ